MWEELPEPEIRDVNYVYPSFGYDLNANLDGTRLDYAGETEYGGKTYHKFVCTYLDEESGERVSGSTEDYGYAMFASREFSKLTYPYAEALYTFSENPVGDDAYPLSEEFDVPFLYGFAEVPVDDHNTVVIERRSDTPSADPDSYVDLGLPSGTMWGKKNIGAKREEDYGGYFAWGEPEPRGDDWAKEAPYDWEHAPFNNGSEEFDEAYFNEHKSEWFTEDDTLKPEYDAAHAAMGGSWRMPTAAQVDELAKATSHYTGTVGDVSGMFFTSKTDGSKKIFMPFAGYRYGPDVGGVGGSGYAWSSSLSAGYADGSRSLGFSGDGHAGVSYDDRCSGFAVRGVC